MPHHLMIGFLVISAFFSLVAVTQQPIHVIGKRVVDEDLKGLVEEGLIHAAAYSKSGESYISEERTANEYDIVLEMTEDIIVDSERMKHDAVDITDSCEENKVEESCFDKDAQEVVEDTKQNQLSIIDDAESTSNSKQKKMMKTDSYGFPLSIFTKGSLFHPYLSISYLDMIRSEKTRAYCIGATNALFIQRRDLLDVIVTVDENGDGNIDIVNVELRRALTLTAADLRFIDFVWRQVETNAKSPSWEGSDDWIRLQTRAYLLSLIATVRADLKDAVNDFNEAFVADWKISNNYRIWSGGDYPDLASAAPGHPFAGGLSISDVLLRVEHSVGGSESGRRVASAVASTGKYFSGTSTKMKTSITSWLKGNMHPE